MRIMKRGTSKVEAQEALGHIENAEREISAAMTSGALLIQRADSLGKVKDRLWVFKDDARMDLQAIAHH